MSVIVALKFNNGVVIGADRQCTIYNSWKEESIKIKKFEDSNTVIGISGSANDFIPLIYTDEIIDYKDIYKKTNIDGKYIYENVIPNLFKILREHNCVYKEDGIEYINSDFILANCNGIYVIGGDKSLYEKDFYYTIGCGLDSVNGYFNVELDGKKPEDISQEQAEEYVKNAIVKACKTDCFVGMGCDIFTLNKPKES